MTRWLPAGAMLLGAAAVLGGSPSGFSFVLAAVLLVLALGFSPLVFPRSPGDEGGRRIAAERRVPLVYWRPGCSYCFRLRLALGVRGSRAVWVDVSRDEQASLRVRAHNGGDETVPTVWLPDGEVRTNPDPAWVRAAL
mgnify:CR=1 FL=1